MRAALRPKQQRFVDEYLADFNATQAAIRAGYKKKCARQVAQRLLTNDDILAAVDAKRDRLTQQCDLTAERVLHHLACVCFADIRKLFDARGRALKPHQLDSHTAAAVAGIEYNGKTFKYRFSSRTEALNLAGRYFKLFKDDAPVQPQAGMYVLLAPAMATPDEWTKLVRQHQTHEAKSPVRPRP
jgi:phage terminase small subunit